MHELVLELSKSKRGLLSRRIPHLGIEHVRPASLPANNKSVFGKLPVGALHGHEAHAELPGQTFGPGELAPCRVHTVADVLADLGGDLLGSRGLLRVPVHG